MIRFLLLLPLFLAISAFQVMAAPQTPPASAVGVCSAIVYDLDNDAILFEQNVDQRIPPASLTKVMSMLLARDYIRDGHAKYDTPVKISAAAANEGGSRMGLRANELVTFKKLLMGMAVSSGNDASYAIAEAVGGSAPSFVKMMNTRARELGMRDSHFANPNGLPADNQYTTARDMLALARAYLKAYPDSLEMHNTKVIEHAGYRSWNKNPLLDQYPGADGLKSGWIRASGYNLIFTAKKGDRRLLAVILGAPDVATRGGEACRLLDAGFMVCDNEAATMAAALDSIPFDGTRIDPLKTGREAGLLKSRKKIANNNTHIKRSGKGILPASKSVARKKATPKRTEIAKQNSAKRRNVAQSIVARSRRS